MKNIPWALMLVLLERVALAQDSVGTRPIATQPTATRPIGTHREIPLSLGTFSTLNARNQAKVNPALSGSYGDYVFDNRYNYEAPNTASLNVGKRIFKDLPHIDLVPMIGVVTGSFDGFTGEVQASGNFGRWFISTDNQFSLEYHHPDKSIYFNWSVARYKITRSLQFGITSNTFAQPNMHTEFDKGLSLALYTGLWSCRLYAYNFTSDTRFFWLSIRYNFVLH